MTKSNQTVIIKKIPLSKRRETYDRAPVFPPMPKMYLELIENKNKIKQELVNKEYVQSPSSVPRTDTAVYNTPHISHPPVETATSTALSSQFHELMEKTAQIATNDSLKSPSSKHTDPETQPDDTASIPEPDISHYEDDDISISSSVTESDISASKSIHRSDVSSDEDDNHHSKRDMYQSDYDSDAESAVSFHEHSDTELADHSRNTPMNDRYRDDRHHSYHDKKQRHKEHRSPYYESESVSDDSGYTHHKPEQVNRKIHSSIQKDFGEHEYPSHRSHMPFRNTHTVPETTRYETSQLPSLSDLNIHKKVIPNLEFMETDTEKEDLKRELLFKFDLLKKSYSDIDIPEFSIHSDYTTMQRSYEQTVKRVSIDSSVESYKTYLIGAFMVIEYVCGNWMGFDMQGFTQYQISSISTYERLLIELGEKSYVDQESQWSLEARFIGLIILQTAFFIVSKIIMKKTGSNILNMVQSMNKAPSHSTQSRSETKRRMRGPNINLDNIPEL